MEALFGIGITGAVVKLVVLFIKGLFFYADYVGVAIIGCDLTKSLFHVSWIGLVFVPLYYLLMVHLDTEKPRVSEIVGTVIASMTSYIALYALVSLFGSYQSDVLFGCIPYHRVMSSTFLDVISKILASVALGKFVDMMKRRKRNDRLTQ